jgi:putative transposase
MKHRPTLPRLKGFRFPRKLIACAVRARDRLALSAADVEDRLAERGVIVRREAIGPWVNRFGGRFAACIRRDRPRATDKRHLDEVVVAIDGVNDGLWRAIDAEGDMRDILVQPRRNAKAAERFFRRLTPSHSPRRPRPVTPTS